MSRTEEKGENTSQRVRRVCTRPKSAGWRSISPSALTVAVAILVLGVVLVGLVVGLACSDLFQHYAMMVTRMCHT